MQQFLTITRWVSGGSIDYLRSFSHPLGESLDLIIWRPDSAASAIETVQEPSPILLLTGLTLAAFRLGLVGFSNAHLILVLQRLRIVRPERAFQPPPALGIVAAIGPTLPLAGLDRWRTCYWMDDCRFDPDRLTDIDGFFRERVRESETEADTSETQRQIERQRSSAPSLVDSAWRPIRCVDGQNSQVWKTLPPPPGVEKIVGWWADVEYPNIKTHCALASHRRRRLIE